MIKVEIIRNNNNIKKISILGHAMYDEYGKDIVCASVSTLVISTVNNILSINSNTIKVEQSDSKIIIEYILKDNIIDILINNMISNLNTLANNYPKNIKIIDKEE
mgnify:FL=1